ncbi:hypothetical protein WG954_06690 [Lacibacter sp. H375]|uniref:hypothetical protein n=1 Tax=Lacibacter sp. H375 TaxID=3133424 RepID=UPI0030BA8274
MQQCLFCGHTVELVHVHGHYQCPVCFTNALPCCDGDNCHTNQYFIESLNKPSVSYNTHEQEKKPGKSFSI